MPFTGQQHSRCSTYYSWFPWLILLVLLLGGALTAAIFFFKWTPQPDKDPRIQTLKTSLHLNIPKDVHYTYICLHHDDWSGCMQLDQMLRGSMTFNITAERTKAHRDESKADIAFGFYWGCLGAFLFVCAIIGRPLYNTCRRILSSHHYCKLPKECSNVKEDASPRSENTASSPLIAPAVSSKVQQTQNASTGGACSSRVEHPCAVNIISQIDPSFDAGPELIGTVDGHVKELEAKIRASAYSSEAPLKPKTYDCFIIYSRDDEDFVYDKLIPFFNSNNIKYCEHQEHFELGKNIFDNVNTCITQSRRVVAVLSKSFFASGYCMDDLNAARGYAASNGYSVQDFLISIKITNFVFPPKYCDISNFTYADLSEDINDERKWLQIKKALTECRLASVVMRIDMDAKYCTPKSRLPVQDVSVTASKYGTFEAIVRV